MIVSRFALTPAADVASRIGVSIEAVELARGAEIVDLHLESYIPPRLFGYDLFERHDDHWLGGRFFGHLDFPRAIDGGLTGAMWSIATNILRGAKGRYEATLRNLRGLRSTIEATEGRMRVVRTMREWNAARSDGAHAAILAIQGGNALEAAPDPAALEDVVRVTLIHLSTSVYGNTSSPAKLPGANGLRARGKDLVERLDAARIFVDLAHIDRRGFWDAVDAHDKTLPLIDTHTGVSGVRPHWRNLDDDQIRAIAETGGVIGIMFAPIFLRARRMKNDAGMVIAHLEHLIDVGGEECAALGSDYDGFITPPPDLRDGFAAYYRLVQRMLDAGWKRERIENVLGRNFLRSFEQLRPG